jgi:hydrogenase expression/formation protein HypC
MCLAYPYQILEITGPFTAKASVDGVTKEIYISLIGEPLKPGDWVLVHVGFAIQKVDETLAFETFKNYHDLFSEDSP